MFSILISSSVVFASDADALDKLETFASIQGPAFYGLPQNENTITLVKKQWTVPSSLPFGNSTVIPLYAKQKLHWQRLPENKKPA